MLKMIKQKIKHTAMALIIFSLVNFSSILMAATSTQKDAVMTESLFSRTKPQCIGRYLIDVPESFNNQLKNMVFIDDFKIESKPQYRPPFEQRISRREAELIASINIPGNKPETAPYLKEIIRLPNGKGVIFDHNEPGTPDIYRQLELTFILIQ